MTLTDKQQMVLETLVKGNPDGSFLDLDELIQGVPYETTKASIQFIIRNLIGKGLIYKQTSEKRRARRRVVISPTTDGYDFIARKRLASHEVFSGILFEN